MSKDVIIAIILTFLLTEYFNRRIIAAMLGKLQKTILRRDRNGRAAPHRTFEKSVPSRLSKS